MSEEKKKPLYEQLLEKANALNEELPAQLHDKLKLYGQVKEMYGDYHAKLSLDYGLAKAKRKEMINYFLIYGAQLSDAPEPKTVSEKEAQAELAAKEQIEEEEKLQARVLHFRNRYESITEQIQILKKKYEHLVNVARGGI